MDDNIQRYLSAGQTSISNELLSHYRQLGMDNDDLILYLQVESLQNRSDQASPEILARIMQVTPDSIIERFKSLIKRQLMRVEGHQRQNERYDFTPMYEKLLAGKRVTSDPTDEIISTGKRSRRQVIQTLEQEFGRMLSPMELQTVVHWFDRDHFDPNMMLLAIQEAVANNARSLRYIEAILANWQRDNLTSPQAVEIAKMKRRGVTYTTSETRQERAGNPGFSVPHTKIEDM